MFILRAATIDDAAAVGHAAVQTWQTAYRAMVTERTKHLELGGRACPLVAYTWP